MKRILATIIIMSLAVSTIACGMKNETPIQAETEITRNDESNEQVHLEEPGKEQKDGIIGIGGRVNYNTKFFEATETTYEDGSLIDDFPLLNAEEEFWAQVRFNAFPTENCDAELANKLESDYATWDMIKGVQMQDIDMLFFGGEDNIVPSLEVKLLTEDLTMTLGQIIVNRDWHGSCIVNTEKHMDTFFPIKADSVAEMIVANYGQPTYVTEYPGEYTQVTYDIMERSVSMRILENPKKNEGDLPYQINIYVRHATDYENE